MPTVSWSTPASYAFAFAGIAPGSVVAVSTVGVLRDPDAHSQSTANISETRDLLVLNIWVFSRKTKPVDHQ